jgi:hypothetical protein
MAIVGDHPETGVRFVLERPRQTVESEQSRAPWVYQGDVFTPDARFPLEVHVSRDGDVRVASAEEIPSEIVEKARLLFRTLYRQARAQDAASGEPPRKVVRWRGEK